MSDHAVRPVNINGLTAATNAAVTATAAGIAIGGTVMIAVGIVAAFPIYIMFGKEGVAATLTASTGFRLPAGFVGRISAPMGATHLYHLRAGASDSDISVMLCDGGI